MVIRLPRTPSPSGAAAWLARNNNLILERASLEKAKAIRMRLVNSRLWDSSDEEDDKPSSPAFKATTSLLILTTAIPSRPSLVTRNQAIRASTSAPIIPQPPPSSSVAFVKWTPAVLSKAISSCSTLDELNLLVQSFSIQPDSPPLKALDSGHITQMITRLPRLATYLYDKSSRPAMAPKGGQEEIKGANTSRRDQKGTWENGTDRHPLPKSYLLLFDSLASLALTPPFSERFSTRQHSNILWSIARLGLGHRNKHLTNTMLTKLFGSSPSSLTKRGNAIDVSNAAWAVARLVADGHWQHQPLQSHSDGPDLIRACEVLLDASECVAREMGPQEVSNTLWSFGKIIATIERDQSDEEEPSDDVPTQGTSAPPLDADDATRLAQLLRSRVLGGLLASRAIMLAEGNSFGPQHVPQVAWACSKMASPSISPSQPHLLAIMEAIVPNARSQLRSISAKGLSMIAWSFANLKRLNLGHESQAFYHFISQDIAKASSWKARKFTVQGLSNLSWALSSYGYYDSSLYSLLAREAMYKLDSMNPLALSSLLSSWAEAGYCQVSLFEAAGKMAVEKMDRFKPETLARLLTACSKVGHVDSNLLVASSAIIQEWAESDGIKGIEGRAEGEKLLIGAALAMSQGLNLASKQACHPQQREEVISTLSKSLSSLCSALVDVKRQRGPGLSSFSSQDITLAVAVASVSSLFYPAHLEIHADYSQLIVAETQSLLRLMMRSLPAPSNLTKRLQLIISLFWACTSLVKNAPSCATTVSPSMAHRGMTSEVVNLLSKFRERGVTLSSSNISLKWRVLLISSLSLTLSPTLSKEEQDSSRQSDALIEAVIVLFEELSLQIRHSERQGRDLLAELSDENLTTLATALSNSSSVLPHDLAVQILDSVASEGCVRMEDRDQRLRSRFESRRRTPATLDLNSKQFYDQIHAKELAVSAWRAWVTLSHDQHGKGEDLHVVAAADTRAVSRTIRMLQRMTI